MKIRQLYEKNTGEDIMPKTHTQAVRTPSGMTAEQVHTHLENALQGKGTDGSAQIYPQLFLDNFTTLAAANEAFDDIFVSTNWKYQGRIRANVLGQAIFIEQYALNANRGYWMQVAYGVFAPSSDGSSLVQEQSKPHISYRFRNPTTPVGTWRELLVEGLPLKTINNVSLVGTGNIEIGQGGSTVTVDTAMDESSENPVQNKVVKGYIDGLFENFTPSGGGQGDVIVCQPWAATDPNPSGCEEGDYCFNTSTPVKLKKLVSGSWVEQTISTQAVYVDSGTRYIYVWNGTSMVQLFSQPPATSIDSSSPTYETICVTAKAVADYVAAQIGAIPTASSTVAGLMPSYYVDILNTFFLEGLTMADKGSIPTVDSLTELPDNPSNLQYGVSYDSGTGAYTLKYYLEDLEGHGAWETSSLPALVEMDGSVYLFRAGEDPVELGGGGAVDTSLSTSSTRPVQNNVLTAAIKDARNSIIVPKYWGGNVEQSGVTFLQGDFWYDGNGTLKQRDALGGWDVNYVDDYTPMFIQHPSTGKIYLLVKSVGHYDVFDYFGKKVRFIEWRSISSGGSPTEGTYRYDASEEKLYVYKNSAWVNVGIEEDVLYVDAGNGRIHVRHTNRFNDVWLDDVVPALNERVVLVRFWGDDKDSTSVQNSVEEGEYLYDTIRNELYKCIDDEGTFSTVSLSTMSLYVDAKNNKLYRYSGYRMVELSSGESRVTESMQTLWRSIVGIDDIMPLLPTPPLVPTVGMKYLDLSTGNAMRCTALDGEPSTFVIRLRLQQGQSTTKAGSDVSVIKPCEGESISLSIAAGWTLGSVSDEASATGTTLVSRFKQALEDAGYSGLYSCEAETSANNPVISGESSIKFVIQTQHNCPLENFPDAYNPSSGSLHSVPFVKYSNQQLYYAYTSEYDSSTQTYSHTPVSDNDENGSYDTYVLADEQPSSSAIVPIILQIGFDADSIMGIANEIQSIAQEIGELTGNIVTKTDSGYQAAVSAASMYIVGDTHPVDPPEGTCFFDKNIQRPVWYVNTAEEGETPSYAWRDANGENPYE